MDRADTQSVVVEAESWQKALQAARAARGDSGPISGFSIELLDEGYRAVDPMARLRYDVKRAADDAVATVGAEKAPPPPQAPVGAAPPPRPAPHSAAPAAKEETAKSPVASRRPPAPPPAPVPKPAVVSSSKRPTGGGLRAVADPPQQVSEAPPTEPAPQPIVPTIIVEVAPPNGNPDATIRTDALYLGEALPASADDHAARDAEVSSSPDKAARSADAPPIEQDGPIPPTQVIFKREHDPNERLPLTYREYVFTVARGVDEASGERLLRAQLDQVRASIAGARPGKFVNLAVFDVIFQGRPPVPPLATLAWKDWKGEAQVVFPRRGASRDASATALRQAPPASMPAPIGVPVGVPVAVGAPMPTASAPAPAPTAPQSFPAPVFPAPTPLGPAVMQGPASVPPPPAPAHSLAASQPPPPAANNPFTATAPAFPHVAHDPFAPGFAPLPPGVPVPPLGAPPAPVPASAPPAAVTHATLIAAVAPSQVPPAPPLVAPPAVVPATLAAPPPPPPPGPFAPAAGSLPQRRPSDSFPIPVRPGSAPRLTPTPSRPSFRSLPGGRRATGDELIANLFEAMHELNFARDVIEGGDYVLALALEMIPFRAGLVHLYDIDRREYVVACVSGAGTEALLNRRHAENDPVLSGAMRKRRALVLTDARNDEATWSAERFAILGGASSVIISPVMKGGRFIGVIELLNPLDGIGFTDDEGNAIDYLSEQFGEFVATRGTQLDPDRIARSVPPTGL